MERNSPKKSREHLVAEQKGLFYSFLGVSIAALFAIIFRGVFSDAKVKFRIEELLKNSDLYGSYSLEGASLSLSDRGLPQLALVLKGGELLARTSQCQPSPLISFDEARIPISFFELFQPGYRLDSLLLKQAHLSFKKDANEECDKALQSSTPSLNLSVGIEDSKTNRRPLPLSKVVINRLVAQVPDLPHLQFEFEELVYEKKGDEKLSGRLSVQNLKPHAVPALIAYFELSKDKNIQGQIKGHWREGKYSFKVQGEDEKNVQIQGELSYFPLQSLVLLSRDQKLDFEPLRTWLSTEVEAHLVTDRPTDSKIHLSGVKIEGKLAETSTEKIQISFDSRGAWQVEPFILKIQSLRPGQLLKEQGQKKLPPIFSSLGQLEGEIHVATRNQFSFEGAWRRPELIFSSRGQRVSQVIDVQSMSAQFDQGNISFRLSEISVEGGSVQGEISYGGNEREGKIELDLQDLSLSPEVEALMTSGGEITPMSIKGEAEISGVKLSSAKAQLEFEQLSIDSVLFEKNSVHVQGKAEALLYQLGSDKVECRKECFVFNFLAEALPEGFVADGELIRAENFKASVEVGSKYLKWSDVEAEFSDQWSLNSSGERVNELSGEVELYNRRKLKKSWKLRSEASEVFFVPE